MAHFTPALTLGDRDRNCRLMDIKSDECAILHVVSPPILEALRQPIWRNPRTENAAGEAAEPVSSHGDHGV